MHWCCGMQLSHKESLGNSMEWKNIPKMKRGRLREGGGIWLLKRNGRLLRGLNHLENFFGVGGWDRDSLYSSGYPGTHSEDQAGLQLRNPPASAFQVLGLKVCTTTAWLTWNFTSVIYLFVYFQDRLYIAQSGPKLHACCSEDDDDLKFMILLPPPLSSGTIDVCNHA